MVDQSYLLAKKPPPSPLKRFFDLTVMPATIDLAGLAEAGVEKVAVMTRQRPALVLGAALAAGATLSALLLRGLARRASGRAFGAAPWRPWR